MSLKLLYKNTHNIVHRRKAKAQDSASTAVFYFKRKLVLRSAEHHTNIVERNSQEKEKHKKRDPRFDSDVHKTL